MTSLHKKLLWVAGIVGALTTIGFNAQELRPVLWFEHAALAAEYQMDKCILKREQLNNAYARRDDYIRSGSSVPEWLQAQIATLEQYVRTNC